MTNTLKSKGATFICKVILETVLMEQANFVIIDHKKYPDCIRITIKNYLRCPLNLLDIFSRKLFCGAIRPFLEAAGLITVYICRREPFCYVIVIQGGEGGQVVTVTPSPGRLRTQQNCRPRKSHAEMFKCISYLTHFRLAQNETTNIQTNWSQRHWI